MKNEKNKSWLIKIRSVIGSILEIGIVIYLCVHVILIRVFVFHWILSLFPHTFFHHRYSSHLQFGMSRTAERAWYIISYIFQGPSYLVPQAYAVMHRLHHWYADTEKDPHSPMYSKNLFDMMWRTKKIYSALSIYLLSTNEVEKDEQLKILKNYNIDEMDIKNASAKHIPRWDSFDRIANSNYSKAGWVILYTYLYASVILPWGGYSLWFLPLVTLHCIMAPLQGVVINWYAHRIGERTYKVGNTSTNLFGWFDILMWGERNHNSHHKNAKNPNFAFHGKLKIDPTYWVVRLFARLGIVSLKPKGIHIISESCPYRAAFCLLPIPFST